MYVAKHSVVEMASHGRLLTSTEYLNGAVWSSSTSSVARSNGACDLAELLIFASSFRAWSPIASGTFWR